MNNKNINKAKKVKKKVDLLEKLDKQINELANLGNKIINDNLKDFKISLYFKDKNKKEEKKQTLPSLTDYLFFDSTSLFRNEKSNDLYYIEYEINDVFMLIIIDTLIKIFNEKRKRLIMEINKVME